MFQRFPFPHYLVAGGTALGLLGLFLWWKLPIVEKFPPFALTSLLAIGYGGYELWRSRSQP